MHEENADTPPLTPLFNSCIQSSLTPAHCENLNLLSCQMNPRTILITYPTLQYRGWMSLFQTNRPSDVYLVLLLFTCTFIYSSSLTEGRAVPVINVAGGPEMSDMRHIIGSLLTSPASIIYNGSLVQLLLSDTLQPTTPMTKHYRSYHQTNLSVSGEIQDILGHMEIGDCNWCLHLCVYTYTYWADCNSDFNVVY